MKRIGTLSAVAFSATAVVVWGAWSSRWESRAVATIPRADAVRIYEGLPSPLLEQGLHDSELQTKRTVDLEGHPFYEQVLSLNEPDPKALTELIQRLRLRERPSGLRKCGLFVPEYAVEWDVGADQFLLLISFACGEAKLFAPGRETHRKFDEADVAQLARILKPYRRNRPTPGVRT